MVPLLDWDGNQMLKNCPRMPRLSSAAEYCVLSAVNVFRFPVSLCGGAVGNCTGFLCCFVHCHKDKTHLVTWEGLWLWPSGSLRPLLVAARHVIEKSSVIGWGGRQWHLGEIQCSCVMQLGKKICRGSVDVPFQWNRLVRCCGDILSCTPTTSSPRKFLNCAVGQSCPSCLSCSHVWAGAGDAASFSHQHPSPAAKWLLSTGLRGASMELVVSYRSHWHTIVVILSAVTITVLNPLTSTCFLI